MHPFASAPRPEGAPADFPMVVGGRDVAAGADRLDVTDPYTGRAWARVPQASDDQVDAAVEAARTAFATGPWAASTPPQRAGALRRLADVVADHVPELTRLQVMENGKAIREQYAQTLGLAGHPRFFAGVAETDGGRTLPIGGPGMLNYTVREPIGVVAAITPWNSPLSLLLWKLAPALAARSRRPPRSGWRATPSSSAASRPASSSPTPTSRPRVNTYRRTSYASPFGGYKDSGVGRENGVEAMAEFTETKSVWIDAQGRMTDPFNPFA